MSKAKQALTGEPTFLTRVKCFWTWPWGHVWGSCNDVFVHKCKVCGFIVSDI